MGKCKRFEVKGFLNFLLEAEIRAVPKTWEKWIFTAPEKYGKTQTFHIYGFLEYFGWSRNPYNSQIMGKVNLLNTGKVWENIEVSQILHYLTDLELMRTHAIPNTIRNVQFSITWKCSAESHILPRLWFFWRN